MLISHVSSISEKMSRDAHERGEYPVVFFRTCPSCKQNYQDDVESMLVKAELEFVEREYKNNHLLYIDALKERIDTLDFDEQYRPEGEVICAKMLSIIKEVDNDHSLQHYELTLSIAWLNNLWESSMIRLVPIPEAMNIWRKQRNISNWPKIDMKC